MKPQLARTANGVIALSTGRPGIYLWLSADPQAASWQSIDLVRHHNGATAAHFDQILPFDRRGQVRWQTVSTPDWSISPANRLLIVYDRDPEATPTAESDRSSIFVVPAEVERR